MSLNEQLKGMPETLWQFAERLKRIKTKCEPTAGPIMGERLDNAICSIEDSASEILSIIREMEINDEEAV